MKQDVQFYAVWNIDAAKVVPGFGRMCFKSASRMAETLEKRSGDAHTVQFAS